MHHRKNRDRKQRVPPVIAHNTSPGERRKAYDPVHASVRSPEESQSRQLFSTCPSSSPESPDGGSGSRKFTGSSKWTHQSVKKIGHDRPEIILESYRAMGFISRESCDEIREISRLMPANLGEEHEVGPDEFVQGNFMR